MEWSSWLIIAGVVALFLVLKRLGLIPAGRAREALSGGARIIDVRSEDEFRRSHLPGAINIPLDALTDRALNLLPDRNQVLLLHCLSGGRSALAKRMLRKAGYLQVFNLGSYARAARILESVQKPRK